MAATGNSSKRAAEDTRKVDFGSDTRRRVPDIIRAATYGRNDIVELALLAGVSVNYAESHTNLTALHVAAASGHLHTVEYLLKNGASTEERDRWGRRALEVALETTFARIIDLLYKVTNAEEYGLTREAMVSKVKHGRVEGFEVFGP